MADRAGTNGVGEAEAVARGMHAGSPLPMVAVEGLEHRVRYANPAFCRLACAEAGDLVGRPFAEVVPEGVDNGCQDLLDRVLARGEAEELIDQQHQTPPGTQQAYWSYWAWQRVGPDGETPVGVMVQVTDTTIAAAFRADARAITAALLQAALRENEMAAEARRIADELRDSEAHERVSRIEAQKANFQKDAFLATLSHELRTPLGAILGWAELVRTSGKSLDADVEKALTVIERSARTQRRLIDDLLDIARITTDKFPVAAEPVELSGLILTAVEALRPAALATSVHLTTRGAGGALGDVWIIGDDARLQQVVWNLITNAIKFTPRGGRVLVHLERVAGPKGPLARVTVTDTGKGIDAEYLDHVFEPYAQGEAGTTRSYGGLGLGLSIARRIVAAHRGSVRAESAGRGLGATFTVDLPEIPTAEPRAVVPRTRHHGQRRLVGVDVLLVDDDDDLRFVLGRALEDEGATVRLAAGAEEGSRLALDKRGNRPHIAVIDLSMPGEDGYACLRRLRADSRAPHIAAIALASMITPEDKRWALALGFEAFLAKPVSPDELIAAVVRVSAAAKPEPPGPRS